MGLLDIFTGTVANADRTANAVIDHVDALEQARSGSIRPGVRMPWFRKGQFVSASKLNRISKVVQALANGSVQKGPSAEFILTDGNCIIQIPDDSGDSAGVAVQPMTVVSHSTEHIVCTDVSGSTVNIAKPEALRFPLGGTNSRTIGGVTYTFTSYNTTNQTRHVAWAGGTEDQVIVDQYLASDVIWAAQVQSTGVSVSGVPLIYLDVNVGARAWARIYGDKIVGGSKDLTVGVTTGSVTGLALSATPQQVVMTVHGNDAITAHMTVAGATADGFSYFLSGAPSDGNAWLDFIIFL